MRSKTVACFCVSVFLFVCQLVNPTLRWQTDFSTVWALACPRTAFPISHRNKRVFAGSARDVGTTVSSGGGAGGGRDWAGTRTSVQQQRQRVTPMHGRGRLCWLHVDEAETGWNRKRLSPVRWEQTGRGGEREGERGGELLLFFSYQTLNATEES